MSLFKSIGNVVGSALNSITGVNDSAKTSYNYNSKMLANEYANNVALWNMQNDYNTPSAQIARMKDAGIDINPMTYAVGNGSMSTTASSVSAPSASAGSGSHAGNPISMLMSVLTGIEQIDGIRKDNELKQKAIDNYTNEHQPEWLQMANFLGTVLTGQTYGSAVELGNALRKAFGFDKTQPSPAVDKIIKKNNDWWNRHGKYSTKYGDGTWKKHLLDVD